MAVWRRRRPLSCPQALPDPPFLGPSFPPFSTFSHQLKMVCRPEVARLTRCQHHAQTNSVYALLSVLMYVFSRAGYALRKDIVSTDTSPLVLVYPGIK